MTVGSLREALGMEVLRGQASDGLELKSNVVRVFISSTFSDMSSERNALLERAYPELQTFCQSLGLVFEVVDMRWGVRDAIAVDHMTTELCLQEIQSCKRVSVGPTFIALLGNRYGHRPMPRLISEKEFETLLFKLSQEQEGLKLLNKWFWKDSNSVPPTYVLQPITTHFPHYDNTGAESRALRDSDVLSWQYTEARLLQLLRTAALQAEKDGDMSAEQKHKFFKSVTEWEIEQGLLGMQQSNPATLLFVRELPQLRKRETKKNLSQFMDVTADGLLDTEAQDLLASLKSRIYTECSGCLNLHCVELNKGGIDPARKEHVQYLDSLCEQFVSQMKGKISRRAAPTALGQGPGGEQWSWLLQELSHHTLLSADKCAVFCGRDGLLGKICLAMWESTNTRHAPLVVHGPSGVGKTALMCKLAQEMRGLLDPRAVVMLRLLGTSPLSSDVDSVLRSVCLQICGAFGLTLPNSQITNTHEDLVRFFHAALFKVSEQGDTLLLLLDSLDQLSEANHAHKLHWLPREIPPNVHVVISTLDTGSSPLQRLRGMVEESGNYFEVEPLTRDQGRDIIDAYMSAARRGLTPDQCDAVLRSFQQSGSPLHLKLTLSMAKQWASYTVVRDIHIGSTTQEAISLIFQSLERRHGRQLISCALGYIVSSRDGLSEAELRDVLSLDDEVLADIYQYWLPPSHTLIRLPPLLWTRLRHDLGEHLVERPANGIKVLGFYHRQFTEMVRQRYLSVDQQTQRHSVLAEYFLGQWSQGQLKPILLLSLKINLNADRKVPSQPLWFAEGVANLRKLHELPYHLIYAGKWKELRHTVFGSTDWLCCKIMTCGVASVLQDLSLCIEVSDCAEIKLIRDTLLLLKPTLDFIDGQMHPSLLYTEIFARLHTFADMYPSLIGRLCSQCQDWFTSCPDPILVPKCNFLQSPGGALKTTLTGFKKGVTAVDLCSVRQLLVAGSEDGVVIAWNLNDFEVIHTLVGHTAGVQSLRLIDRGAHCLSSGSDGSLRRWSLRSGKQLYCIHEAVSISPQPTALIHVCEETNVVFTNSDGQVHAWHLETAELLFKVGSPGVTTILGVLEEAITLLSDGGLLTFYDSSTGLEKIQTHLTSSLHSLTLTCALILPNHRRLLIASKEGLLYLVSNTGRQAVTELPCPASFLAVSDDQRMLFAGCESMLALLHVQPNSVHRVLDLQHGDTVLSAAGSSQRSVVITGAEDQIIRVWCSSTGDLLDSFNGMGAPVSSLAVHEHTVISASSSTYYLKLWQLDYKPKHRAKNCLPANCSLVTLSRNGETVYFVKDGMKEVFTWNCNTGTSKDTLEVSAEVCCLELAQQKKLLFCGLKTGTILIYPLAFSPETLCIPPPESLPMVRCMAVSREENRVAVAYEDAVCLFEITARDSFPSVEGPFERYALTLLQSAISSMALLSDSRLLYGTDCGEVTLYDFKSTSATALKQHCTKITCVTMSNWGTHALVGSQDCVQRLWGLTPLQLDHTMEYKGFFFEGVLCSAFSLDDKYVFTGSQDRTIKVWDVSSGNLLFVQYVYASITKMMPHKDGLVAISQLGFFIKEGFRCPESVSPGYNPLQNFRAQFRVTSRDKTLDPPRTVIKDIPDYNPAQFAFINMFKTKPSHTCLLL